MLAQSLESFETTCQPTKKRQFLQKRWLPPILKLFSIIHCHGVIVLQNRLRRNPPDVEVTSGQKSSTKIIYIVLQTSVGLF